MKRKRKGDISGDMTTLKKFIHDQNVIDILSLYLVYESECQFEGCYTEQELDVIAIKVLQWEETKVNTIKDKLIEIGLIEIFDEQITYTYIHVNYLMQ